MKDGLLKVNVLNLNPSEVRLIEKMREIKFGSVEIKIQDGKTVEVEYREKERMR